jgi:hypothetical protein
MGLWFSLIAHLLVTIARLAYVWRIADSEENQLSLVRPLDSAAAA